MKTLIFLMALMPSLLFAGDFNKSCDNIELTNYCDNNSYCNLGATCLREDSSENSEAWINLYNHIGNSNGRLTINQGGFSETCRNIGLIENVVRGIISIEAVCENTNGVEVESTLPLSRCISNNNGELFWSC